MLTSRCSFEFNSCLLVNLAVFSLVLIINRQLHCAEFFIIGLGRNGIFSRHLHFGCQIHRIISHRKHERVVIGNDVEIILVLPVIQNITVVLILDSDDVERYLFAIRNILHEVLSFVHAVEFNMVNEVIVGVFGHHLHHDRVGIDAHVSKEINRGRRRRNLL